MSLLLIYIYIYSAIQQPNKYYKYARKKRSSENKKLVFLSKKVLEEVSTKKETTGTNVKFNSADIPFRLRIIFWRSTRNVTW